MSRTLIAIAMLCALPAGAQDRLQPDFTFHNVRPPGAPQTDPGAAVKITRYRWDGPATPPPAASAPALAAQPAGADWFWSEVPAERDVAGTVRMAAALRRMDEPVASAQPSPRLAHLAQVAQAYGNDMLAASVGTKVSPALALAVISVESSGQPLAESSAGAQGLMQLIPATADRFGVDDPLNPSENIRGGIAYLDWLINHFNGDVILAIAAYNAGEGAVRDAGGVPPYPETRTYVPKVLAAWKVARGLCQTPPQLMSDGCVFVSRN